MSCYTGMFVQCDLKKNNLVKRVFVEEKIAFIGSIISLEGVEGFVVIKTYGDAREMTVNINDGIIEDCW